MVSIGPTGGLMPTYHPYWTMEGGYRHKNPRFDEYSNMILNLKNRSPWAIRYFYRFLKPMAEKDTVIVVVPSHDPEKKESGIYDLAKLMCRQGLWIDGCDCLTRTTKIPKLAIGGSRSILAQKSSLSLANSEILMDRTVFLLDDVKTTGNTFIACEMILKAAGAKVVKTYALGETLLRCR